jgi:ATP-dependent Lon protease
MLNERVRTAISKGRFHIFPVSTVDEGITLLTGVPAGSLGSKNTYPKGSINRLVVDRLAFLADRARQTAHKPDGNETAATASTRKPTA